MSNKKKRGISKLKEKLDMYDMIMANLYAGNSVVEPSTKLDNSHIDIGFSNIASETHITKYFMIRQYPDWMKDHMMDIIRSRCLKPGVKINFYIHTQPHTINWNSSEMKNRLNLWTKYADKYEDDGSVFEYRGKRSTILARKRIIESTKYLNESELDYRRTLCKITFIVEISAKRDDMSLANLELALRDFKTLMNQEDFKVMEMRVNMIDWLQSLGLFSLKYIKEVQGRIIKKIVTDDILANFSSYKQGRIGEDGVPLGIDISSKIPVLHKFKEDPDAAENLLIAAATGGGKSFFLKALLTWLLGDGFVCTVMDYEGDEYTNLAAFVKAGNPDDVKVISMGKGSEVYFEPMEIPMLTGDPEVDNDLKETAISYVLATFRLIVCGTEKNLTKWEESVISTAIRRVYEFAGVTDNKETWHKSQGLRVSMVYDEICDMVRKGEFIDDNMDNIKHRAAMEIQESCIPYFEEGEAKSGTFKKPMTANELFKAKLIIFSFGMKGATNDQIDPVILALKQLSVANISIQISNHCKYVKHCFNVKVWEEYQRWGEAKGSAEIIGNAMTGGRKRGDVNFIITNDLNAMLDESNPINAKLKQNITGYIVGRVTSKTVIHKFCEEFSLLELEAPLRRIAEASRKGRKKKRNSSAAQDRYKNAFCVVLDEGKAIVKVMLPPSLLESDLFKTGVVIK